MREEETRLRDLVDKLGNSAGGGIRSRVERVQLTNALHRNLAQTKAYLKDCLSGRNAHEQCLMEYRIRVEFPLYSHLNSIFTISSGAYADSDCA
jgi:hypothetical protein